MTLNALLVAVRALSQFACIFLSARWLGSSQYSLVSFGMAVIVTVQVFIDGGLSTIVASNSGIEQAVRRVLHWWGVVMAALVAAPIFVVGFFLHSSGASGDEFQSALSIGVFLICSSFAANRKSSFEAKGQVVRVSLMETLCISSGSVLAIVGVYLSGSPQFFFFGLTFGAFLQAVVAPLFLRDNFSSFGPLNVPGAIPFARNGLSLIAASMVGNASSQADIFIGRLLIPSPEFGTYALIRDLCVRLNGLVGPVLNRVFLPKMAREYSTSGGASIYRDLSIRLAIYFAGTFGAVNMMIGFTSLDIFRIIFGANWAFSGVLLSAISLWGWCKGRALIVGPVLYSSQKYSLALKWNIIKVLPVLVVVFLAALGGAERLAIALGLLGVLEVILQFLFIERRISGVSFAWAIILPAGLSVAVAAGAYAFYSAALHTPLSFQVLYLWVAACVIALVCSIFYVYRWSSSLFS